MAQVVVGTDRGLFALDERNGAWSRSPAYLDGLPVMAVAKDGPGHVLVATRGGGLFRIDHTSGSSTQLGAEVLPKKLRSLAVSPRDPKKIYAGAEPAAVFISDDGGATWRESEGVRAIRDARSWKFPSSNWESHIRYLMVCEDDPRYVYAAGQVGGLLRSEDGGESWIEVLEGIDPDVHAVLQHPARPQTLYLVCGGGGPVDEVDSPTWTPPPLPQGRPFYRSDDRGKTWSCISAAFDRHFGIAMAAVPAAPVTLIAGVARDVPPEWHRHATGADAVLLYSRDDGASWERSTEGLPASFGTMIDAVEVDRERGNRIFIGTGAARKLVHPSYSGRPPELYVGERPAGPWTRLPFDFPGIATIVAV